MVSDDKKPFYDSFEQKSTNKNGNIKPFTKTSAKFANIPTNDRISLYSAICSDCNHEVKVNFEPIKDEPFYCDYCYVKHRVQHHTDK